MKGNSKHTHIKVGNISSSGGEINIAGGDINKNRMDLSAAEIHKLFDQLYAAVETRADTKAVDKSALRAEIQEVQSIVIQASEKEDGIDDTALARHFRNIAKMAPDILEVVIASLTNPLAGLGIAVKKIAEKAKGEA